MMFRCTNNPNLTFVLALASSGKYVLLRGVKRIL